MKKRAVVMLLLLAVVWFSGALTAWQIIVPQAQYQIEVAVWNEEVAEWWAKKNLQDATYYSFEADRYKYFYEEVRRENNELAEEIKWLRVENLGWKRIVNPGWNIFE